MATSNIIAAYCIKSPLLKIHDLSTHNDRLKKMDPSQCAEYNEMSVSMIVDRAKDVFEPIKTDYSKFKKIALIVSQDSPKAVGSICNFLTIAALADDLMVINSNVAALSFVLEESKNYVKTLGENDRFAIITIFINTFRIYYLSKKGKKYNVEDCNYFKRFTELIDFFRQTAPFANFKKVITLTDMELSDVEGHIPGGYFVQFSNYEKMLLAGAIAKMIANIKEETELEDFGPYIVAYFKNKNGAPPSSEILMGPGAVKTGGRFISPRNIEGFSVTYGSDVAFVATIPYCRNNVLIPYQQCERVVININICQYGLLFLKAEAQAATEAWDPVLDENLRSLVDEALYGIRPTETVRSAESTSVANAFVANSVLLAPLENNGGNTVQSRNCIPQQVAQRSDHSMRTPVGAYLEFALEDDYISMTYCNGIIRRPCLNANNTRFTPLCIAFFQDQILLGLIADKLKRRFPEKCFYDLPKILGLPANEIEYNPDWKFELIPCDMENAPVVYHHKHENVEHTCPPYFVLSNILAELANNVEHGNIRQACFKLSVSTYKEKQISAVLAAAKMANLVVFDISLTDDLH